MKAAAEVQLDGWKTIECAKLAFRQFIFASKLPLMAWEQIIQTQYESSPLCRQNNWQLEIEVMKFQVKINPQNFRK